MYAINIGDMTKDLILSKFMLAPVLTETIINAEPKNLDGAALLIQYNIPQDQINAIIDMIRVKYHKNLFRVYHSKNGKTWKRV